MQIIELQSCSIWAQKCIKLKEYLEIIEKKTVSDIKRKTANSKIIANRISKEILYFQRCLKMLVFAILIIFLSTYTASPYVWK